MNSNGSFTGIVHLSNLPDDIYISLRPKIRKEIVKILKEKFRYLYELSEKINEPVSRTRIKNKYILKYPYTLFPFISGRYTSLRLIKKLSRYLVLHGHKEFRVKKIERYINGIKANRNGKPISNPKFPIGFNSKSGVSFVSAILHDGCIDIHHRVQYSNKNSDLVKKLINNGNNVFGKFSVEISDEVFLPTVIGKILIFGLDMQAGRKTINNVEIPKFITESKNKTILKSFLQQAFDDEGSVVLGKKSRTKQITFNLSVDVTNLEQAQKNSCIPKLLLDNSELLQKLNIKFNGPYFLDVHISKDKRVQHKWGIAISGINNLITFSREINFYSKNKSKKLRKAITEIKRSLEMKGRKRNKILKTLIKIQSKYGAITSRTLSDTLKIPLSTASSWLSRLYKDKKLKFIRESSQAREFLLIEEKEL